MIFLRLFTIWTVSWFFAALVTSIYGAIVWGTEPVGHRGTMFLAATVLAQPVLCAITWGAIELYTLVRDGDVHPLRWVINWTLGRRG